MRLRRLVLKSTTFEAFLAELRTWPAWYLKTTDEKRMGIQQLREFYSAEKGVRS